MGFLLGYGMKKVAAILLWVTALVSGLFMLALAWLASLGAITINFTNFTSMMDGTFAGVTAALVSSLTAFTQILPMGGSFGLGFYIGARKG